MKKILKLYCPFDQDIAIERSLGLLETEFRDQKLGKTIRIDGTLELITDRISFVRNSIRSKNRIPIITNGLEQRLINYSGYTFDYLFESGPIKLWYIVIEIAENYIPVSTFIQVVKELSLILKPFWATLNIEETERTTALQLQPSNNKNEATDLGLPKLKSIISYHKAEIPSNIAWINYWSRETIQYCLRANNKDYKQYIYSEEDLEDGSKVIQVTKEPLNLSDKDHLQRVKNIYDAIPEIGGRNS